MSEITKLAKKIVQVTGNDKRKKPAPYDTQGTVTRVDRSEGKVWVRFKDGVDETPVKMTADAKVGDIVPVRVSGGQAWLYGNATAPPTDDTLASVARRQAVKANDKAIEADEKADIAKNMAEEAGEYKQYMDFEALTAYTGDYIEKLFAE